MPRKLQWTSIGDLTVWWSWRSLIGAKGTPDYGPPPVKKLDLDARVNGGTIELACPDLKLGAELWIDNPKKIAVSAGFTQTVYLSWRRYYYASNARSGEARGDRADEKRTPVWGGSKGDPAPWFMEPEPVTKFARDTSQPSNDFRAEAPLTVWFNDAPRCAPPNQGPLRAAGLATIAHPERGKGSLFYVEGLDSFESFIALEVEGKIHVLDGYPYHAVYGATFDPASKALRPTSGSGLFAGTAHRSCTGEVKLDGPESESVMVLETKTWVVDDLPKPAKDHLATIELP